MITSSSHEVIDPSGIDTNGFPYLDIASVNESTQVFFTAKRAAFSYTAELQQFVADATQEPESLLLVENMASSSHWDNAVLGNVVNGDDSQEAVATLVGASNSNVYIIFDIVESNNLVFSFSQDPASANKVTSWEVAHRSESGWVVLKTWGDATPGLNTFTANANLSANKIRFRFRTTAGSNLAINQLAVVSNPVVVDPIPDPTPTPGEPILDTDLSGYTGYTDENGITTVDVGFFENKVFDETPDELIAEDVFADTVNDTARLKSALNQAKREVDGGVVRLLANPNGQNRFSLSHIAVPSNTRIEVEPGVVLEMRGTIKEDLYPTSKNDARNKNRPNRQFLFSFGRSNGPGNLLAERIENVEVRSTVPGQKFTIDATTNMPHDYGYMNGEVA